MRTKIVAGNWKMNTSPDSAKALASGVAAGVGNDTAVTVIVCPPFPLLGVVAEAVKGSAVKFGAQNCFHEPHGAFTGEVSPQLLREMGCEYVILGHSERRHKLGEMDDFINRKVHAALQQGLKVIICFGETIGEREDHRTHQVLEKQFKGSLSGVQKDNVANLVLAYEPVWAIGTGHTATPEQAQEAHTFIRGLFAHQFGAEAADSVVIQYGGSMKPDNAPELMSQPDVDGGLIGGASLKADDFLAIVAAGK